MGLRACALKKREIELGDSQVLNWESDTLAAVINYFCNDAYTGGDYDSTDTTWNVDAQQFKEMISEVEKMTEEEFQEEFGGYSVFADDKISKATMVSSLKKLYEDGKQVGDGYIYIVWV